MTWCARTFAVTAKKSQKADMTTKGKEKLNMPRFHFHEAVF